MIEKNTSLKEILDLDTSLNNVAQQFGLDDMDKELQLEDMCKEKEIDTEFFIEILKVFQDTAYFPRMQLGSFPIYIIIDYLKRTHKFYLNKRLLEIEQSITISYSNNKLKEFLHNFFLQLKSELVSHIQHEESMLFPYIQYLYDHFKDKDNNTLPERLNNFSISSFEASHSDDVENKILSVRKFIVEYNKDVVDLSPYRVLLHQLDIFEHELRVHALVEDEILIPKAMVLEKELLKQK